jgi:hypothetical protein
MGETTNMKLTYAASAITRRRVIKGAATVTVASLLNACAKSSLMSLNTGVANPQPVPAGTLVSATLSVSAQAAGAVPANFLGFSYDTSAMARKVLTGAQTNLIGLLQRLGSGVLRVGAIPEDQAVWNQAGAGGVVGQVAPSDVDALAAFLKATGWKCIYGLNLEGYPPAGKTLNAGVVATTPALAAAEVAYVVNSLGSSLLGLEIGNEPDNYGWTLAQYETQWQSMRSAILALSPGVPITGPATGNSVTTWAVPFGQTVTKSQITMLTQHYYISCGCTPVPTVQNLLSYPDTNLINNYLLPLQAGAASIGIPYRMTEANSYYTYPGTYGLQDSYASALWIIDFMFTCAQYGAAGVNILSGGYGPTDAPISDTTPSTTITPPAILGPRPEYYGMELFSLAGTGTLNATTLSTGTMNVSAYAVKTAAGSTNIVVNNKTTSPITLQITLPQTINSAVLLQLTQLTTGATGPNLSAAPVNENAGDQSAGTMIQGSEINVNGTFADASAPTSPPYAPYTLTPSAATVTCYVPALSAVVVQTT